MNVEHLVRMANDIGDFFQGEPIEEERIAGVANHLRKFWDPRMRRQIQQYAQQDGSALSAHVRAAVLSLNLAPT